MNVADSEVVLSIMRDEGFVRAADIAQADIRLVNTCSIREHAEERIWNRLKELRRYKKARPGTLVGVIGCMAERLKDRLIERESSVDIVAGPDAYRDLPALVRRAGDGARGVNVMLSREETYADVSPVRMDEGGVSAFISIMRGCNNHCAYCVVPYTRGEERSRPAATIMREVGEILAAGYREVTLLGQNVNSYRWEDIDFAALLAMVAGASPALRVRFATSHPKDLSDRVLETMAAWGNICRAIHLPAQSGSTRMLALMNRKYTREWYLERIAAIRRILPDCAISTDLIAGFCTETPQDHADTLSLMRQVGYQFAYMFKYSERPGTKAARTMEDDVSEDVKTARLNEIIALQNELSLESNRRDVGRTFEVLVEGRSKRSEKRLFGRTSGNKVAVFDRVEGVKAGDYVQVRVTGCSSATLTGELTMING
jgi:tRNA-2-methylthio-N6-dimethylallyladenosine synthase